MAVPIPATAATVAALARNARTMSPPNVTAAQASDYAVYSKEAKGSQGCSRRFSKIVNVSITARVEGLPRMVSIVEATSA
jgi:hypothetical protein